MILVLAADHQVNSFKDFYVWAIIAAISHIGLAPLVAVIVPLSERYHNWRFDTASLIVLGAIRGVIIDGGYTAR